MFNVETAVNAVNIILLIRKLFIPNVCASSVENKMNARHCIKYAYCAMRTVEKEISSYCVGIKTPRMNFYVN